MFLADSPCRSCVRLSPLGRPPVSTERRHGLSLPLQRATIVRNKMSHWCYMRIGQLLKGGLPTGPIRQKRKGVRFPWRSAHQGTAFHCIALHSLGRIWHSPSSYLKVVSETASFNEQHYDFKHHCVARPDSRELCCGNSWLLGLCDTDF